LEALAEVMLRYIELTNIARKESLVVGLLFFFRIFPRVIVFLLTDIVLKILLIIVLVWAGSI
jgi:hypothetical protein